MAGLGGTVYEDPSEMPSKVATTYTAVFCVNGEWVAETVPLSSSMFKVDISTASYTGSAITKSIKSGLESGTDYEVSYNDNVKVGTATITITGKGNYTGTLTYSFTIEAAGTDDGTETYVFSDIVENDWYYAAVEYVANADEVSDWATGYMAWSVEVGLISGTEHEDGTLTLESAKTIYRERAAMVLYRAMEEQGIM